MRVFIFLVGLFCFFSVHGQEDYDYLSRTKKYLEQGECEKAEKNYKTYQDLSGKSNATLERGIADCKMSKGLRFTVNEVSFDMVYVEGGSFTMGCTSEQGADCFDIEKPSHEVSLSAYHIGEFEVTQGLWKAVMGSNPSFFKGDKLPVEEVNWDDCQDFISELNRLTGKTFSLPTEAQWEYAARGGNKSNGYKYAGSNNLMEVSWYVDNSSSKTHEVGTKSANELGIYDMSGNVWEWCSDWYGAYSSSSQTNPSGPTSGYIRVNRGGSWGGYAQGCRVSGRSYGTPTGRYGNLGFRLSLVQ